MQFRLTLWLFSFMLLSACADLRLSSEQEQQLQRVAKESPPAGEPVFHVIGLYRGLAPPWYKDGDCAGLSDPQCQMVIQDRVIHGVDVRITDIQHPITLGLSAYERTRWRIQTVPGVEIERIILSGHSPQYLTGVGPQVSVEYYVEEEADCPVERCVETGPGFYGYQAPALRYEELVSQPPTSFIGAQEEGWIEIGPNQVGVHSHLF